MTDKATLTLTDDGAGGVTISVEFSERDPENTTIPHSHVILSNIVQGVILPMVAAAKEAETGEDSSTRH